MSSNGKWKEKDYQKEKVQLYIADIPFMRVNFQSKELNFFK